MGIRLSRRSLLKTAARLGAGAIAALTALTVVMLTDDATGDGQSADDIEVRINARQLEDGRVEFALEHDGARVLPRSRYFPANAEVNRWLRSSPVTIELAADDAAVSEDAEYTNVHLEAWKWSSGPGGAADVQLAAGWWRASIVATYRAPTNAAKRDHGCFPSISTPGGVFAVSAIVSGQPVGSEDATRVFQLGQGGDAPAGWWRVSADTCNSATFNIRPASEVEIEAELTRRSVAAEAREQRQQTAEELRRTRDDWLERHQARLPAENLCDHDYAPGVLARVSVGGGVFDQLGYEAWRWPPPRSELYVVLCQADDDPFELEYIHAHEAEQLVRRASHLEEFQHRVVLHVHYRGAAPSVHARKTATSCNTNRDWTRRYRVFHGDIAYDLSDTSGLSSYIEIGPGYLEKRNECQELVISLEHHGDFHDSSYSEVVRQVPGQPPVYDLNFSLKPPGYDLAAIDGRDLTYLLAIYLAWLRDDLSQINELRACLQEADAFCQR